MTETQLSRRVEPNKLLTFTRAVLDAVGVEDEHAEHIAKGLVQADLRGVDSHGVARLEAYVENFEAGGFSKNPEIGVTDLAGGVAIVDGDEGPGQSVGMTAIEKAMDLAEKNGVGSTFVTNSNHFGMAAYFTQYAANEDFIGIATSNVGADVIPFGGTEAFLGTNPISIAVPTIGDFPITLDMATSEVAMGKIDHGAADEGTEIPDHWAVDGDGKPTTDPTAVAALQPLGGPKGYGLAFMVDVFCGLLADASVSPDIGDLYDDFDEPMGLGHWFLAVDVETLMDPTTFKESVAAYVDRLKAQPTAEGIEEIMVPGEPEALRRRTYEDEGIPCREATVASLERLAEGYELDPLW